MKRLSILNGFHRHKVTAMVWDGPIIHQIPIIELTSSGIFTATINGTTYSYLYDRSAIISAKTESGEIKRILNYTVNDAMPTGTDVTEIERCLNILKIDVKLDKQWIDFIREMAVAPKDDPTRFTDHMKQYITTLPETETTVVHRGRYSNVISHVVQHDLFSTVLRLSTLLDTRVVTPDPRQYAGMLPSIGTRSPKEIPKLKNTRYVPKTDWYVLIVSAIVLGGIIAIVAILVNAGVFDAYIPRQVIMAAIFPCGHQALSDRYPDMLDLAVALEKREVKCYELDWQTRRALENVDRELVQWIVNNDDQEPPQPSTMPAPEDMTLDDITITPEEAARQQAEADAAEQARLQAERDAAEELRLQEEAAAIERQARIDREAARVAEFERVAMCGDYDYLKSTYQTSFNIAVGIQTGELQCSLDELPERYRDLVAAQDQRTIDDYIESGYDVLNP